MLFATCRLVKGGDRAVICDLQEQTYRYIPLDLYTLLSETKGLFLEEIFALYDHQYDSVILENLEILEKEGFLFFTNSPNFFPELAMEWDVPFTCTNAIVDLKHRIPSELSKIFEELSGLGCECIQIRFFEGISIEQLQNLLRETEGKRFLSIELLLPYQENIFFSSVEFLADKYKNLLSIVLHSLPEEKALWYSKVNTCRKNIYFSREKITSEHHCGMVGREFFSVNVPTFTESHHHNSCLNRKIAIDAEGNIKNCPSMPQSFGNIKDTTLAEALAHPDFKKYWNITKDQVKVCQDCEFRYICTDCRAYLEDPQDDYSKPLKCGYDPYTGQWAEWSTHPLKQRAIDYYGMREIL